MGCINSRRSRRNPTSSVFKVTNIDDRGHERYQGQMQVTVDSLILHKNRGPPIVLPLTTIRRYGYEEFMFCMEAGRSSPLGQGVFAFRCKDAQHIFNAIREKLHTNIGMKDISSELLNYSGHSCSSTRTTMKKVYDEDFTIVKFSSEANNITQPPDLMLDPNTLPKTYVNMPNNNEGNDNDLLNDPFELLKDIPTYTDVEIAACTPKKKCESLPTSLTELPAYINIDFNRTMHLSQRMLTSSEDTGVRKTRTDSIMSDP